MAITVPEILTLAFQAMNHTNEALAFEKTLPPDLTPLEKDLRIAEFAFPKVISLIRSIAEAVKS